MINFKKERYFFYQTLDKTTAKRTALVRIVVTDVYLDKIQTFMVQLLYITRWKPQLATFFNKRSLSYLATLTYKYKILVEIDVNMSLEVRCYYQEIKKHKYVCLIAKVCKQLICKSSGLKVSIELSFYKDNFLIWRWIIFYDLLCFLSMSR